MPARHCSSLGHVKRLTWRQSANRSELAGCQNLECVIFTVAPDRGARAELQPEGLSQVADLVSFYKQNASILREVRCLWQLVSAMDRHMD